MANLPALQPVNIQPVDIPNALSAHYKLQQMQQSQDYNNALMTAGPGLVSDDPTQQKNALATVAKYNPAAALQFQSAEMAKVKSASDMKLQHFQQSAQFFGGLASLPDDQVVQQASQSLAFAKAQGADTSQFEPIIARGNPAEIKSLAATLARNSLSMADQIKQQDTQWTQNHTTQRDKVADNFKRQEIGIQQQNANTNASKAVAPPLDANPELDPTSKDILSQTGLSMNGFMYLTGQASKLGRDAATRNAAAAEAKAFAKRSGTDVSTLGSQYKAYNDTLHSNVVRNNQMQILDGELTGTIRNLKPVADAASLGSLKVANVAKLFSGEQFTDPTVQQYSFYLKQLQSEVAGYLAAARGNLSENGSVKTDDSDMTDAASIIKNGLNSRQADGLLTAVQSTQEKAKSVLSTAVHSANKQVWGLFGLADNYDKTHPEPSQSAGPAHKAPQQGKFTEGQIYKDASGNRAKYVNGQFVPVQ